MAKQNGLGWTTLTIDNAAGAGQDLRNDVTDLDFATPRAVWDVTGIDKFAFERLLNLADFTITPNGVFNPSANKSHAVFSTVSSTSVLRTTAIGVGGVTLSTECLYSDYQVKRSNSGEFTWSAPGSLADGTVPTWA